MILYETPTFREWPQEFLATSSIPSASDEPDAPLTFSKYPPCRPRLDLRPSHPYRLCTQKSTYLERHIKRHFQQLRCLFAFPFFFVLDPPIPALPRVCLRGGGEAPVSWPSSLRSNDRLSSSERLPKSAMTSYSASQAGARTPNTESFFLGGLQEQHVCRRPIPSHHFHHPISQRCELSNRSSRLPEPPHFKPATCSAFSRTVDQTSIRVDALEAPIQNRSTSAFRFFL